MQGGKKDGEETGNSEESAEEEQTVSRGRLNCVKTFAEGGDESVRVERNGR